ncbi:NfeD family protein [Catonella massiliensis]|uniref:NfeD family protein n=1 Tax=Catonella massiliensis TaxID=2799636 RepID=A0ABS1IX98_9FIRM|nr:NfeD family protein [Catonella massiliensis]MBK5896518.1 NfeD family protein [Catonella massiliensis]
MDFQFWLMAFIILVVMEFLTMGLTTIWFAIGALVSFFASLFGASAWIQIVLFLVVSLVVLIVYRPLAVKYVNSRRTKTNVDDLIGREAKVVEKIDNLNETGRVLLNGIDWSARSTLTGGVIEEDTIVKVMEVQGVKLIVEPLITEETKRLSPAEGLQENFD